MRRSRCINRRSTLRNAAAAQRYATGYSLLQYRIAL